MHRLFSDLVISRYGATAPRIGPALPASLLRHAATTTIVVFEPVAPLTNELRDRLELFPESSRLVRVEAGGVASLLSRVAAALDACHEAGTRELGRGTSTKEVIR